MAKTIAHRVESKTNATYVWDYWMNVDGWPVYEPDLKAAGLDGNFMIGGTGWIQLKDGTVRRFEIVGYDHGKGFELLFSIGIAEMRWRRTIASKPDGCWFEHEVTFTGLGRIFLAGKLGSHYEENLPTGVERLRRLAETGSV